MQIAPPKPGAGTRVLGVRRISHDTEASSALVRQKKEHDAAEKRFGFHMVGDVEDATVSGSVNLADRPSLGKWMVSPKIHEWEALMVTAQDRITRDDWEWMAFLLLCREHGKHVIILEEPSFDLYDRSSRMMSHFRSYKDSEYLDSIKKKKRDQVQDFRENGLWPGGNWPFGYRTEKFFHEPSGKFRWKLVIDPVTSKLVREAYSRIVEQGWTTGRLVSDWNKRKILTARDYQRHVNALEGRENVNVEVKGTLWSHRAMLTMLSKRQLIGQRVHKGEVIMGPDSLPQKFCDPILTQAEWDALQAVLKSRGDKYRTKEKVGSGDLTGVLYCLCGRKQHELYTNKKATKTQPVIKNYYPYFWCSSKPATNLDACEWSKCWPQKQVKAELESAFLHRLGNIEIKHKSFKPGVDNRPQIEEVKKGVDRLTSRLLKFDEDDPRYIAAEKLLEDHTATLKELEKNPVVPSRWVEEGTGVTFGKRWGEMDWEQRGWLLKGLGVRFISAGTPKEPMYFLVHPDDVVEKAHHAAGGIVDALNQEVWLKKVEEFQRIVAKIQLAA
ncbi:recombinase family protein [Streptomyces noursei]|uniref:recombinase family protein n=1 Tax=Streptomyces noursei TaxID=1971 RepID=UPI0033C1DF13